VVVGLGLVLIPGGKPFDPLFAIGVALNNSVVRGHLVWRPARGLLDYSNPVVGRDLRQKRDGLSSELGVPYHGVRFPTWVPQRR